MWRQAKKSLMRTRGATTVAAVWGFDTGLAITTFRVGAVTWGALILTLLGFGSWWNGIAYGISFTLPMMGLLLAQTSAERLQGLLNRRALVQSISAVLLIAAGGLVLI